MATILLTTAGEAVKVNAGESAIVTATLYDAANGSLAKAAIATLTATLKAGSTVINSRDDQTILDANGGTVAVSGVLTLKLQPADNVIMSPTSGESEKHILTLAWTWVDGDGDTLTGSEDYEITVKAPISLISDPIVIGDDYLSANGRAIEWTIGVPAGVTAGTSTCQFGLSHSEKGSTEVTGTITDNSDGTWTLGYDLAASDTASLSPGEYEWSVQVTDSSSNELTLRHTGADKATLIAKQTA